MESWRMKLRFPRSLLSTLTSCKSQDSNDVIQQQHSAPASYFFSPKSVLLLDSQIPHSSTSIEPLLPNQHYSYDQCRDHPHPSSAICKPRCPGTFDQMVRENCILPVERRKITNYLAGKRNPLFAKSSSLSDLVSREMKSSCPPGPPPASSPFTHYYTKLDNNNKKKKRQGAKETKKKQRNNKADEDKLEKNVGSRSRRRRTHRARFGGKLVQPFRYEDWLNTDDEDDEREEQSDSDGDYETDSLTDTLFSSSRSFLSLSSSKSVSYSSDYSDAADGTSRRMRRGGRRRQHNRTQRKSGGGRGSSEVGPVPLEAKVKGSFAVVKSSSDPYNDFQTSMVEMIMEKQIFGEKELQQLFQCFLSLNSSKHHRVIAEVFADICGALFHK